MNATKENLLTFLEHLLAFSKGVGIMIGIGVIWWVVAAVLLFLAGGIGPGLLDLFYIFWPVSLAVLSFLSVIDGCFGNGFRLGWPKEGSSLRLGPASGTALALYMLPIILNGLHYAFSLIGWVETAALLYSIRWFSAPLLICSVLVLLGVFALLSVMSKWLRENFGGPFVFSV